MCPPSLNWRVMVATISRTKFNEIRAILSIAYIAYNIHLPLDLKTLRTKMPYRAHLYVLLHLSRIFPLTFFYCLFFQKLYTHFVFMYDRTPPPPRAHREGQIKKVFARKPPARTPYARASDQTLIAFNK